ncbi:hypothetical protein E4U24_000328 [Claviceps purpurea]|nr:hypothetical protein E4U12_008402 [Claviceps purpurea]KAG6234387.1 hypothetical protein E4U24_000328 [Claviceps purpurea]KAG6252490.1 hypothetical protein E4U49_007716 [Claviceps purpurea]
MIYHKGLSRGKSGVCSRSHPADCQRRSHVDVLSFIKGLDEAFPHLLAASGDNTSPSLALEVRTQVFTRLVAAKSGEPDVAAAIASLLCASDDSKDNSNHDAGPNDIVGTLESLFYTGETEEEIQDITSRTRQLAAVFCKGKEYQGLRRLEEDFPLKPLLQELHTWCREEYRLVRVLFSKTRRGLCRQ